MSKVLAKYKSTLEKSFVIVEKEKKNILLWVIAKKDKKTEVLSFDNLHSDRETALSLIKWFEDSEKKGTPVSEALNYLEKEAEGIERIYSKKQKPVGA